MRHWLTGAGMMLASAGAHAQSAPAVEADGTIHVPAMTVPPSTFISREARDRLAHDAAKAQSIGSR